MKARGNSAAKRKKLSIRNVCAFVTWRREKCLTFCDRRFVLHYEIKAAQAYTTLGLCPLNLFHVMNCIRGCMMFRFRATVSHLHLDELRKVPMSSYVPLECFCLTRCELNTSTAKHVAILESDPVSHNRVLSGG